MKMNWKTAILAGLLAGVAMPALAADPYYPPEPAPVAMPAPAADWGGWYIRGDLDYHKTKLDGANYTLYAEPNGGDSFDFTRLSANGSVGGGLGYQINNYFRTDFTADYWWKTNFRGQTSGDCGDGINFCTSIDRTKFSALVLLANAYVEVPVFAKLKAYGGAGIGGTYVKWDNLDNTIGEDSTIHPGRKNWRFTYALMAGASYCLTSNLKLDAGYRYTKFNGGEMFGFANGAGPGYDEGGKTHEGRIGLRYSFGPTPDCTDAPPAPVYTK